MRDVIMSRSLTAAVTLFLKQLLRSAKKQQSAVEVILAIVNNARVVDHAGRKSPVARLQLYREALIEIFQCHFVIAEQAMDLTDTEIGHRFSVTIAGSPPIG